jgi:hypothetical protein
MTGSTWGDVAIIVFIGAIAAWWVARLFAQFRRARSVIDMTGAQIRERIDEERRTIPAAQDDTPAAPTTSAGPWSSPPPRQ